ncbi:MAG: ATP-dependent RecD-like DNA helicase [Desulfobacterales bacterium]|nr:ATP-dependent RecD-like DNA helicase [Desulfobacterales bacterium]
MMKNTSSLTTLEGRLEHITYYNQTSHFAILKLRTERNDNFVNVLGFMPEPNLGEILRVRGNWQSHPKYGQQLKIESFEVLLPAGVAGITKYLESGFIKGIGPKMAGRLVNHFQETTLKVIEENPERLVDVKGIGKEKAMHIAAAWKEHHAMRGLVQFLYEKGVKASYCAVIYNRFGKEAVPILQHDPYRAAVEIPKIGFYIADAIVRHSENTVDETERAKACTRHLLEQMADEGHVFAYESGLLEKCKKHFHIEPGITRSAIEALAASGHAVVLADEKDPAIKAVYAKDLYDKETEIVNRINALLTVPVSRPQMDHEKITATILKRLAIRVSAEQLGVIEGVLSRRLSIITGGPGTGKTTLIKSIATILGALGKKVLLAAPTGRAARRLSEVTQKPAATIHKVLGFNLFNGSFEKNPDCPLDADTVIVDEASMIDIHLMFHLLRATPMQSALILVGDVFQLPSVGPGNILMDMIQSNRIKTYELKKIFRQSIKSPIIINAHKVRSGQLPDIPQTHGQKKISEFYFIEQNNPGEVVKRIIELCRQRIPDRFGFDPVLDLQVITPMHKGLVGTIHLNQILQEELNPNPITPGVAGNTFKMGDKVMHLINNYQKEVFNGDIGIIRAMDKKKREITVEYDGREVRYDFEETNELSLAYAISVHKSQGSEYPAVVVPIMMQHFALLQRNLLYTAITRATKLVIIIGTKKALMTALENDKSSRRNSNMALRLKGE